MLKPNRCAVGIILLSLVVLTAMSLTGCGGSDSGPAISFTYLDGGLRLGPDFTGMLAVAAGIPVMISPTEMQTAGGGRTISSQVLNEDDSVVPPFDKETWKIDTLGKYNAQLLDDGIALPGRQPFKVVTPFSESGGLYVSLRKNGVEQQRARCQFVIAEPDETIDVDMYWRPAGQPTSAPAAVKVFDLNGTLSSTGNRWIPRLGFYKVVATRGYVTVSQWVFVARGKG